MGLFSKPKKIKAPKADFGGDISKLLSAYQGSMPGIIGFEQQFRPDLQKLNLADAGGFIQGIGGTPGLIGLSALTGQAGAGQVTDILGQQAPGLRAGLAGLSPEAAQATQAASQEAQRATLAAQGLSPEEARMAQQQAREGFAASGRLGGNAAILGEALGREDILARKRGEAAQARGTAFDMSQGLFGAPGLALLGQGLSQGQGLLSAGLGAVGAGTPQLFSPDAALNLGAAERQNAFQAQLANQQAAATQKAGVMGLIGKGLGSAVSLGLAPLTGGSSLFALGMGGMGIGKK